MKFTFGTDPEFVLVDKNNKACSAIPILKGDKNSRKKSGNCYFYYDNVLGECSLPPASSKKEAVENIGDCLKRFAKLVRPYKIAPIASYVFDKSELLHEDAFKINCEKEICAYAIDIANVDEKVFEKTDLRSAGGHIHLGNEMILQGYNSIMLIKMLDLFLGIPSIFVDHDPSSKTRKKLYGNAGRYRCTPYGVEYRSMGNFWLSSPKYVELIYDICDFSLDFVLSGKVNDLWTVDEKRLYSREAWSDVNFHPSQCHTCTAYDVDLLRKTINNMDVKSGKKFLSYANDFYPTKIKNQIEELSVVKSYDLYEEWKI